MFQDIDFGQRIRELLKSQGVPIQDAAEKLGYTRQGFSSILDKEDVNTSILKKICNEFDIDITYFFTSTKKAISVEGGKGNVVNEGSNNSIYANHKRYDISHDTHLAHENIILKDKVKSLEQQIEIMNKLIKVLENSTK